MNPRLAVVGLAAVATVAGCANTSKTDHTRAVQVTYTVTGTAPQVDVTYQGDENGTDPPKPYYVTNEQRGVVPLPYTRTVTIKRGGWAYLWAQNRDQTGGESCSITVGGKPLVPPQSDDGPRTVCTVGGTV